MPTVSDGKIRVTLTGTEVNSIASGGVNSSVGLPATAAGTTGAIAGIYGKTRATGTGNGLVNAVISLSGTITAGTPVDIDMKAIVQGSRTVTLTGIKDMLIQEVSATPNSANKLLVGDSAGTLTNALVLWTLATGQDVINQGGARCYDDYFGFTVDNTHKVLRLQAAAGTAIYQLDILGTV